MRASTQTGIHTSAATHTIGLQGVKGLRLKTGTAQLTEFARLEFTASGAGASHLRLVLHGDIDLADESLLTDTLDKVSSMPPADITVDLTDVTFLSSTGLRLLAALRNNADAGGNSLTVTSPAPIVLRTLQICGFDKAMTIVPASRAEDAS
jgi:anti-sigma B factor antagonist